MGNKIGTACNITTGKLDANQASPGGEYPFYTCAANPDRIDSYAFDDDVVLVAGNNAQGNFHVSRYSGKFNAYQRTYVLTAKKGFDIDYIYYSLKLELKRLKEKSQGSQTKFLTKPILTDINLGELTCNKQTKIANVLKSIDAKIELNNRINSELEAMAKLFYDYWFVQFDFSDSNGEPYKTSGGKMVYHKTLKREIPEGWKTITLEGLVDLVKGNVSPNDIDANTPYVGIEHIGRKTIVLSEWDTAESVASDKTMFHRNDILFGKIRPYFHKVAVAPFDGITSTDTIILRPKKKNFYGYSLETVFSDAFIRLATQSATGSKMPRADWSVLKKYTVPLPESGILTNFQSLIDWALNKIELSVNENQKLQRLRDWLLPMLMNGQVTVK